jgi:hypothetical protein
MLSSVAEYKQRKPGSLFEGPDHASFTQHGLLCSCDVHVNDGFIVTFCPWNNE